MTVKTKPVARATLDDWPLAEAGLSFRATRSIRAAGLRTVGQLRGCPDAKLLELWSFGRKTLVEVHAFFGFCERLEQGQQTFLSLREVFELFLPANQREILYARFQMEAAASHPPRRRATLQHIGTARKLTRERVRQIEARALAALQSRPAQVCLEPFYDFITALLAQHEHVADAPLLQALQTDARLDGWQPAGVLALMAALNPTRLQYRHDRLFSLSEQELRRIEQVVLSILNRKAKPLLADQLLVFLQGYRTPVLPAGAGLHFLRVWLDHHPAVAALADGRYFSRACGAPAFLAEVSRGLRRPFHYLRLLELANRRLKPGSRRGTGTILEWLAAAPGFTRIGRGLYDYTV